MRPNKIKAVFINLGILTMIFCLLGAIREIPTNLCSINSDIDSDFELNDLILKTRRLADTVYQPNSFSKSFKDAVCQIRLVAEIDPHISTDKSQVYFKSVSQKYFLASSHFSFYEINENKVFNLDDMKYISIKTEPPDPPPESISYSICS